MDEGGEERGDAAGEAEAEHCLRDQRLRSRHSMRTHRSKHEMAATGAESEHETAATGAVRRQGPVTRERKIGKERHGEYLLGSTVPPLPNKDLRHNHPTPLHSF